MSLNRILLFPVVTSKADHKEIFYINTRRFCKHLSMRLLILLSKHWLGFATVQIFCQCGKSVVAPNTSDWNLSGRWTRRRESFIHWRRWRQCRRWKVRYRELITHVRCWCEFIGIDHNADYPPLSRLLASLWRHTRTFCERCWFRHFSLPTCSPLVL